MSAGSWLACKLNRTAHLSTSWPIPRLWLAVGWATVLQKQPDTFSTLCLCRSRTGPLSRPEPSRAETTGPQTRRRSKRRRRSGCQCAWEELIYLLQKSKSILFILIFQLTDCWILRVIFPLTWTCICTCLFAQEWTCDTCNQQCNL